MTGISMTCQRCGAEMNHQATKLTPPVTAEDALVMTEVFDGVLVHVFACPSCGFIDARRADAAAPEDD